MHLSHSQISVPYSVSTSIRSLSKYLLGTYVHRAPIPVTGDGEVSQRGRIPACMELVVQ